MTLIKTSVLSFISTAVKIIAGLVINKAIAAYIGPTGLALVGQFQNFTQMVMTAAQGAINNGVTKYTAEYGKRSEKIPILFSTATKISISSSLIVAIGLATFSDYASLKLLKSESYAYVFIIFAFTIFFFVLNNLLLSILNGLHEINKWVSVSIVQSIYSLIFTTLLIIFFGLDGALIALVTNQSIIFFILIWMLRNHEFISLQKFTRAFDKQEARKLMGFAAMALTSAIVVPTSQLFIRNYIGDNLSWQDAGYWQAIWYISTMYLMVVTTTLSIYYLPKLSALKDKAEIRKELLRGYKMIMPIVLLMSITIYLLRDVIIWVLFTEEFEPMRELFLWQLIGDVIKLAAWLMSYLMIAKGMVRTFIGTEIGFSVTFVLLSMFFVEHFGLVGMSYSFACNYSIYLIVIYFSTKKQWVNKKTLS